ncbi:hypothetical protein [Bittarella sp. HCP28S3_D9]|uniref:hypothetical protein n=1 Tax=Bittarella sp. HCP28S3_D9 TaxID=3440253 RepID=UPI003F88D403
MAEINYDDLLNEIIEQIKNDDSADSATVERLVQRLRELQATASAEVLGRKIIAGDGLAGGGTLEQDVTLRLSDETSEYIRLAAAATTPKQLAEAIAPLLTKAEAGATYATKAEAKPAYVIPFSVPGTINGEEVSPPLLIGTGAAGLKITHIGVAVGTPGSAVTVTLRGGATGSITVGDGVVSKQSAMSVPITGPVRVAISSASSAGVTVTLRVQES